MISKDIPKLDLSKTINDDNNLLTSKNINELKGLKEIYDDLIETF